MKTFHTLTHGVRCQGTVFEMPAGSLLLEILSSEIPIDTMLLLDKNLFSRNPIDNNRSEMDGVKFENDRF